MFLIGALQWADWVNLSICSLAVRLKLWYLAWQPLSSRRSQHDQAVQLDNFLLIPAKAERMDLMELEAYFRWRGQDVSGAIRVDGRYRGCTLRSMQSLLAAGSVEFA